MYDMQKIKRSHICFVVSPEDKFIRSTRSYLCIEVNDVRVGGHAHMTLD